ALLRFARTGAFIALTGIVVFLSQEDDQISAFHIHSRRMTESIARGPCLTCSKNRPSSRRVFSLTNLSVRLEYGVGCKSMMQAVKGVFANQPGRPKPVSATLPPHPISVRTHEPRRSCSSTTGGIRAQSGRERRAGPNRLWHSCQGHIGWHCESRPRAVRTSTRRPGKA